MGNVDTAGTQNGRLRRLLTKITADNSHLDAEDQQAESTRRGGRPIAELPMRRKAMICGAVRAVTLRPRAGVPALEAEIFDGTGTLSLVWLGRRQIAGIDTGRRLKAEGMVSYCDGHVVMFNPRYELLPPSDQ